MWKFYFSDTVNGSNQCPLFPSFSESLYVTAALNILGKLGAAEPNIFDFYPISCVLCPVQAELWRVEGHSRSWKCSGGHCSDAAAVVFGEPEQILQAGEGIRVGNLERRDRLWPELMARIDCPADARGDLGLHKDLVQFVLNSRFNKPLKNKLLFPVYFFRQAITNQSCRQERREN